MGVTWTYLGNARILQAIVVYIYIIETSDLCFWQIGEGVPKLWSDIQTNKQTSQRLLLYTDLKIDIRYTGSPTKDEALKTTWNS